MSSEDDESQYRPITESFLLEHFINEPPPEKEEKHLIKIDAEKVHFQKTPFDRYWYKNKYPLLEDEVCEILEKCSIEKTAQHEALDATEPKKPAITIEHGKKILVFD